MGKEKNIEMTMRVRTLPTHAFHPNAFIMASHRQGYIAMPNRAKTMNANNAR